MTMTAILKGFRRIIKFLSQYDKTHQNNLNLKTDWTNESYTAQTNQQYEEGLIVYWTKYTFI